MSLQFPLNWPKGRARTDTFDKKSGQAFKRSLLEAVDAAKAELKGK